MGSESSGTRDEEKTKRSADKDWAGLAIPDAAIWKFMYFERFHWFMAWSRWMFSSARIEPESSMKILHSE